MGAKTAQVVMILIGLTCTIAVLILVATNFEFTCTETPNDINDTYTCPEDYIEAKKCHGLYAENIIILFSQSKINYTCPWPKTISYLDFAVFGLCFIYFILKISQGIEGHSSPKTLFTLGLICLAGVFGSGIAMAIQIFDSHRDCEKINAGSDPSERGECHQGEFLVTIIATFAVGLPLVIGVIQDYQELRTKDDIRLDEAYEEI